jgi:hypothetical protein
MAAPRDPQSELGLRTWLGTPTNCGRDGQRLVAYWPRFRWTGDGNPPSARELRPCVCGRRHRAELHWSPVRIISELERTPGGLIDLSGKLPACERCGVDPVAFDDLCASCYRRHHG